MGQPCGVMIKASSQLCLGGKGLPRIQISFVNRGEAGTVVAKLGTDDTGKKFDNVAPASPHSPALKTIHYCMTPRAHFDSGRITSRLGSWRDDVADRPDLRRIEACARRPCDFERDAVAFESDDFGGAADRRVLLLPVPPRDHAP